jgi:hypothetical protein
MQPFKTLRGAGALQVPCTTQSPWAAPCASVQRPASALALRIASDRAEEEAHQSQHAGETLLTSWPQVCCLYVDGGSSE